MYWTIAAIRPIRSAIWCFISAATVTPDRQQLSDYTCTALQLANFWQDVSVDYAKGRIYLPLEDLRRFAVSEDDIAQNRNTPQFRQMMKFEVERAREWFAKGLPLSEKWIGNLPSTSNFSPAAGRKF